MAAPHISGAVALCLGEAGESGPCARLTPKEIVTRLRDAAEGYTRSSPTYGFLGDPARPSAERYLGYLQFAGSEADTAAPRVTETSPAEGETGVPTAAAVKIGFSESMDKASVEAALSLRRTDDNAAVAGSFTWSRNTVSFQPSSALSEGIGYTATVGTRATDTAGDALERESSFRFQTAPPAPAAPPTETVPPAATGPPPDTSPPETSISSGPSGTTDSSSASFEFSSEEGSRFECKLDSGDWVGCSSPKELTGLSEGSHRFSVRAIDAAGNVDPIGATRTWTVVTPLPTSPGATATRGATPTPGTRLVAPEQIAAALRADVADFARDLRRLRIGKLARWRSLTARELDALTAGRFSVTVTGTPRGSRRAPKVVLAKGSRSVSAAGRYTFKVKLTRLGRRLVTSDLRAKVTLTVNFRDVSGRTTAKSKSVRLRG